MISGSETTKWLSVSNPEQLAEVCRAMVDRICELEECWKRGVLRLPLSCADVRLFLGPVAGPYDNLDVEPEESVRSYREKWMQIVLDEFVQALGEPRARLPSSVGDCGLHCINHDGQQFLLRLDQTVSVRFWGIGIEPDNSEDAVTLANCVFQAALNRLAGEVGCVGKMCRAVAEKRMFPEGIRWGTPGCGTSFEHLALDILNEDECRARRATLFEDLFEWTDLRVRYPNLPRKHGARVQVKFVSSKEDEKIPLRRNTETHVVLSPVRLANYVEAVCAGGRRPGLEERFWESLGADPADSDELANSFFRLFQAAITTQVTHPMGPLALVPPVFRRLIRRFVFDESFEAAMRMIDTLNTRPNAARTWTSRL